MCCFEMPLVPLSGKSDTKPQWMTEKKKIMELQTLVFSYEKIAVPPEVSVRDDKAVLETARQEMLMI